MELPIPSVVLMVIPIPILFFATASKREWVRVWLFPCSHLAALGTIPGLSSSRLYQGLEGLGAFAVLVLVGGIYFYVATHSGVSKPEIHRYPVEQKASERLPSLHIPTVILAALILGAFLAAIFLEPGTDPLSANIAALTGLFVTWVFLARFWYPRFMRPLSDPKSLKGMMQEVSFLEQITRQQALATGFIVVLTLSMLLVFDGIM